MRDKLIDIILTAQGYKASNALSEPLKAMYESAWEIRKKEAGEIADALLAAGVVQPVDSLGGHPGPVGHPGPLGQPGVTGVEERPIRNKLIDLIYNATMELVLRNSDNDPIDRITRPIVDSGYSAACLADHLIANGVTVQEWVSVEDALPEIGATVLLYHTKYKNLSVCTLRDDGDPYWEDGALFEFNIHHGTHWMPLPAPPKEV